MFYACIGMMILVMKVFPDWLKERMPLYFWTVVLILLVPVPPPGRWEMGRPLWKSAVSDEELVSSIRRLSSSFLQEKDRKPSLPFEAAWTAFSNRLPSIPPRSAASIFRTEGRTASA